MILKKKQRGSFKHIAFLLVIFFLFFIPITVCTGEWTTKILTSNEKINETPAIAIDKGIVHVVWNTWVDNYNSTILYKRSLDNGKTWGDTFNLTTNTSNAVSPVIATSGNIVHVAWKDFRDGNPEIYYIQSIDNGDTWSTPQRLTYNDSRPTNIYDLNIVSEGSQVYLVWKDYRSGSSEIFFKSSSDSGKIWNSDQRITYDYRASYAPVLAVEGNNLYIAFDDYSKKTNVCILSSTNKGETWAGPDYVTMNKTSAFYLNPSIAVSQKIIYLAWEDEPTGHPEIYFTKSVDEGKSYADPQKLTVNSTSSTNPKIYAFNQNVTIIWQNANKGSFDIYLISSNDSGNSWSESRILLTGSDYYTAKIAGYKNNIHIICQELNKSGLTKIIHCVNTTAGNPVVNSLSVSPSMILKPGSIHIIVDGYDPVYNNSKVTCLLQYSIAADEWHNVNVSFNDNFWESTINFSNTSDTGQYTIRTQLLNPDGNYSDWKLGSFFVTKSGSSNPTSSTPGFEFTLIIIVIVIVFFTKNIYNKKNHR